MNNLKIVLVAFLTLSMLLIGCKKDSDTDNTDKEKEGEAISSLSSFWQSQKAAKLQKFTVDASQTQTVTGSQGTKVTLYGNSFYLNNSPVTGMIDIELVEAYDKDDMILLGRNTMGRDEFGNYAPMVSAGEFYFNASQNGQALEIGGSRPQISTAPFSRSDFNTSMIPLILEADATMGDSVWVPIDSFMNDCSDSTQVMLGQSTYCFEFGDNASWTNCDYFQRYNVPLTGMTVNLPASYTNANTSVLISFDGLNLLTNLYENNGAFTLGNGYTVPIGQAINLVVIAEQNGILEYHVQAITVVNNQIITLTSADLLGTTAANLQTQLSNLP